MVRTYWRQVDDNAPEEIVFYGEESSIGMPRSEALQRVNDWNREAAQQRSEYSPIYTYWID